MWPYDTFISRLLFLSVVYSILTGCLAISTLCQNLVKNSLKDDCYLSYSSKPFSNGFYSSLKKTRLWHICTYTFMTAALCSTGGVYRNKQQSYIRELLQRFSTQIYNCMARYRNIFVLFFDKYFIFNVASTRHSNFGSSSRNFFLQCHS